MKRKKPRKKGRALPNPRQEWFCRYFVFGNPKYDREMRPSDQEEINYKSNATQSYIAAGYKGRDLTARTCSSRMMTRANIQARIAELRDEEMKVLDVYLRRWKAMLVDAQDVLAKAMAGEDVSTQAIAAAREVIEQAEGPTRFRFGVQSGTGKDGGLNITLWSGKNE